MPRSVRCFCADLQFIFAHGEMKRRAPFVGFLVDVCIFEQKSRNFGVTVLSGEMKRDLHLRSSVPIQVEVVEKTREGGGPD